MTQPAAPHNLAPGQAQVQSDLVTSVVELVGTGAVMLGAYTLAELTAVDAVVDFLETRPSDEALAEAVRSLAARELLIPGEEPGTVKVRGDLGIAVAFQQRARSVLDARVTGTGPGEPWRVLLMPQPEQIALVIQIDALGVHAVGLYPLADALDRLAEWLPSGDLATDGSVPAREVIAAADRSALVTVTSYTASGTAETAASSTDVALARTGDRLLAFVRDGANPSELVAPAQQPDGVRELIESMLSS